MKKLYKLNLVLLTLNSFGTALVKMSRMDFEMQLFKLAGFSDQMTIAFGVLQLIGAILLCLPKLRKVGALIMVLTFTAATGVLFKVGMIPFGIFSILFIAMAAWTLAREQSPFAPRCSQRLCNCL